MKVGRVWIVPSTVVILAAFLSVVAFADRRSGATPGRISLPAPPRSGLPWDMAVTGHVIWLAVGENDPDARLVRIDTDSGDVRSVDGTTGAMGVAAGEGAVWVSVCDGASSSGGNPGCAARAVAKVDPETASVVAAYPIPGRNLVLAAGLGSVWITSSYDRLLRLDPGNGAVSTALEGGADLLGIGDGKVWFTRSAGVVEYDPVTGATRRFPFHDPCTIVSGSDAAYVMQCLSLAYAVDPQDPSAPGCVGIPECSTPNVVARLSGTGGPRTRSAPVGASQISAGPDGLFVSGNTPTDRFFLQRLDPSTLQPVGDPVFVRADPARSVSIGIGGGGPYGVPFGDYAWIVDPGAQELIRIDFGA
jgi:hypothetical protein